VNRNPVNCHFDVERLDDGICSLHRSTAGPGTTFRLGHGPEHVLGLVAGGLHSPRPRDTVLNMLKLGFGLWKWMIPEPVN
jgi:hypothetical protein